MEQQTQTTTVQQAVDALLNLKQAIAEQRAKQRELVKQLAVEAREQKQRLRAERIAKEKAIKEIRSVMRASRLKIEDLSEEALA